jgi:hypothetical protein
MLKVRVAPASGSVAVTVVMMAVEFSAIVVIADVPPPLDVISGASFCWVVVM